MPEDYFAKTEILAKLRQVLSDSENNGHISRWAADHILQAMEQKLRLSY